MNIEDVLSNIDNPEWLRTNVCIAIPPNRFKRLFPERKRWKWGDQEPAQGILTKDQRVYVPDRTPGIVVQSFRIFREDFEEHWAGGATYKEQWMEIVLFANGQLIAYRTDVNSIGPYTKNWDHSVSTDPDEGSVLKERFKGTFDMRGTLEGIGKQMSAVAQAIASQLG